MDQSKSQPYPVFSDAIIPGRYFNRLGVHTDETRKKLGRGTLAWNTVTAVWVAMIPFWCVLTSLRGAFSTFSDIISSLFSPYVIFGLLFCPVFLVFYPGFYYLFYKQGVSLRHLSHHIFTSSPAVVDVRGSDHWLAWWRAMLLPGVDLGNFTTKLLGHVTGAAQVASFLIPFWGFAGPGLTYLLTDGRTTSFWLFEILTAVLFTPGSRAVFFGLLGSVARSVLCELLVRSQMGRARCGHVTGRTHIAAAVSDVGVVAAQCP